MPALRPLRAASFALTGLALLVPGLPGEVLAQQRNPGGADTDTALTGPRSGLPKDWVGLRSLSGGVAILVMPGHADSQGFGSGASGEAVARRGARPMDPAISDELFWNLAVVDAVVRLGQRRGLNIRSYDPGVRRIADPNDPRTTWSVGKAHVQAGGYALEIHHDAHGSAGIGSGLIPPISTAPTSLDESLASAFGAFPRWFRDGLGGPRRGIAILEIGKLEGQLERNLRNPSTRQSTIESIAQRVVLALERGVAAQPAPTALSDVVSDVVSPPPDVVGSVPPAQDPRASSGAW